MGHFLLPGKKKVRHTKRDRGIRWKWSRKWSKGWRLRKVGKEGVQVKAVWFGLTVALGIWLVAGLAGFVWVLASDRTTFNLGLALYLLGIAGVAAGAVVAGKRSAEKGWLHGLWVGHLLGIIGIITNLELVPELYSWAAIGRQLLVWTLWGVAGGYVGAQFRSPKRLGNAEKKKKYLRGY